MNKEPRHSGWMMVLKNLKSAGEPWSSVATHHRQEPLLVGTPVQASEPLAGLGGSQRLQSLVLVAVAHDLLESSLPRGNVLLGDHIVAVGLALASDLLDGNAVRKADLGLGKTTGVGRDDRNAAQLGLGHNNAPSLVPQRGSEEDLDAVPDLVGVLGGRLDSGKRGELACPGHGKMTGL